MTLVESAAFGAPSIVNNGGKVGATSLLVENKGCVAVDLEKMLTNGEDSSNLEIQMIIDSIQQQHSQKLEHAERSCIDLRQVAEEARSRALGWDEMACCQRFIDVLNDT